MHPILADYDSSLCLFHSGSSGISNTDYNNEIQQNEHFVIDDNMIDYSRLMEEVEFLCRFLTNQTTLVVQGSYPNRHYDILAHMFPQLTIELWDENNLPSDTVTVNTDNLTETRAHDLYFKKNVLFICYLDVKTNFVQFEKMKSYQTALLRAIQPSQCSLTFALPETGNHIYYRGFLSPSVLTPRYATHLDKVCRCIPILDDKTYVLCTYSAEWYEIICNYWNTIAKKGKLLRNSINRTSQFRYKGEHTFCGIEICRVLDILYKYLEYTGEDIEHKAFEKVLKMVTYIDNTLAYSLSSHSARYATEIIEEETEYSKLAIPLTLGQAHEMLFFEDIGPLVL